jgi:hypothetical protein
MSKPYINAEDYRGLYRRYGTAVRWWKALPVPAGTPGRERNGYLYQEVELDAAIRVMIYQSQAEIKETTFGAIPRGSTMISTMPDEIHLATGDRILALGRLHRARTRLRRGSGSTDGLPHPFAVELVAVHGSAGAFTVGTDVALTEDGSAIQWNGEAPAAGKEYGLEWTYHPLYVFTGQVNKETAEDVNGVLLPQMGLLQVEVKS